MDAERIEHNRHALEELAPGLRGAVERVLNDRLPQDFPPRALAAVRRRFAQCPPKARRGIWFWTRLAIAASILAMAVAAYDRAAPTVAGRSATLPASPPTGDGAAAALADDLPTLWAYSQAARRSPEALNELLDRQARQAFPPSSQLLAQTAASPSTLAGAFKQL